VAVADVCVMAEPLITEARQAMSSGSGVPFERIILTATHTHSGPITRPSSDGLKPDRTYMETVFLAGASKASKEAVDTLRHALVGIGETHSDVGVNRREITAEGEVILGQNPYGTYDPVMTVVSFREPDGKPIGNMIHYGAHNTAAGRDPVVTRDWCGVMIDRLETESGGITAFFNGCEGDCGPRLPNGGTTGDVQMAMELGGRAGIDAVRAWRSIREWRADCDMKVLCGDLKMPYRPLASLEELETQLAAMGDREKLEGHAVAQYARLVDRINLRKSGKPIAEDITLKISPISVGPVVFVPIPFETFSIITLRIRQHSAFPYTLSLSNGNGSRLYFPSMDQVVRGGYEVYVFSQLQTRPFTEDAEQYLVSGNLKLLNELHNL